MDEEVDSGESGDTDCMIEQQTRDDFDWSWGSGRTPSGNKFNRRIGGRQFPVTGPFGAQQGGNYIFIEASEKREESVAR